MIKISHTAEWHGYHTLHFEFEGRPALVVEPKNPIAARPWIWRAEFFGHEPQLDVALLKRGWHVAYLQVSDMYGAPAAIEAMHRFQAHLEREFGVADKTVLEGMSRGGLYAWNYASAFPHQVAALYLDNPVLDIRSWPGGLGAGPGDKKCWEQCLKCYGLTAATASDFQGNPLDQIGPVAQAKIPVVAVCGDADEIVPFEENAAILVERLNELGSPVELILKPGFRHHPHSLSDPQPLIQFVQQHLPSYFEN